MLKHGFQAGQEAEGNDRNSGQTESQPVENQCEEGKRYWHQEQKTTVAEPGRKEVLIITVPESKTQHNPKNAPQDRCGACQGPFKLTKMRWFDAPDQKKDKGCIHECD